MADEGKNTVGKVFIEVGLGKPTDAQSRALVQEVAAQMARQPAVQMRVNAATTAPGIPAAGPLSVQTLEGSLPKFPKTGPYTGYQARYMLANANAAGGRWAAASAAESLAPFMAKTSEQYGLATRALNERTKIAEQTSKERDRTDASYQRQKSQAIAYEFKEREKVESAYQRQKSQTITKTLMDEMRERKRIESSYEKQKTREVTQRWTQAERNFEAADVAQGKTEIRSEEKRKKAEEFRAIQREAKDAYNQRLPDSTDPNVTSSYGSMGPKSALPPAKARGPGAWQRTKSLVNSAFNKPIPGLGTGLVIQAMFGGWEASAAYNAKWKAGAYESFRPHDIQGQLEKWDASVNKVGGGIFGGMAYSALAVLAWSAKTGSAIDKAKWNPLRYEEAKLEAEEGVRTAQAMGQRYISRVRGEGDLAAMQSRTDASGARWWDTWTKRTKGLEEQATTGKSALAVEEATLDEKIRDEATAFRGASQELMTQRKEMGVRNAEKRKMIDATTKFELRNMREEMEQQTAFALMRSRGEFGQASLAEESVAAGHAERSSDPTQQAWGKATLDAILMRRGYEAQTAWGSANAAQQILSGNPLAAQYMAINAEYGQKYANATGSTQTAIGHEWYYKAAQATNEYAMAGRQLTAETSAVYKRMSGQNFQAGRDTFYAKWGEDYFANRGDPKRANQINDYYVAQDAADWQQYGYNKSDLSDSQNAQLAAQRQTWNRNPVGAQATMVFSDAIQRAKDLKRSDSTSDAWINEIAIGAGKIQQMKRDYLESFRAMEFGWDNSDPTNTRDTEDVGSTLETLNATLTKFSESIDKFDSYMQGD